MFGILQSRSCQEVLEIVHVWVESILPMTTFELSISGTTDIFPYSIAKICVVIMMKNKKCKCFIVF
jgi:hypothetical protein